MNETEMQHGSEWKGNSLRGWVASEKHDGVRCYWDGETLWTRGGGIVPAPADFLAQLPAGVALDGEIWAGRDNFTEAQQAVQRGKWTAAIRFIVFDAPNARGTYLERIGFARGVLSHGSAIARAVDTHIIRDNAHLAALFRGVKQAKGEGLVVRDNLLPYTPGRTTRIAKVKSLNALFV